MYSGRASNPDDQPQETPPVSTSPVELSKRTGQFLMRAFRRTGFTRKEAAERAGVSEGYLGSVLAGRFIAPKPEVIRRMADAWGFSLIDFYIEALGTIKREDVDAWVAKNLPMMAELRAISSRLDAMPQEKREKVLNLITTALDLADDPSA